MTTDSKPIYETQQFDGDKCNHIRPHRLRQDDPDPRGMIQRCETCHKLLIAVEFTPLAKEGEGGAIDG